MKQAQHKQACFERAGSTKPRATIRDNENHDGGYELTLSSEVFLIRLCAFPWKEAFKCHLTPAKMDRSCTPYFSEEEQIIIMEGYKEYKKIKLNK